MREMATAEGAPFKFAFKVLGKYEARLAGNEPHISLNVSAGRNDNLVFCGTLTLSEAEWSALKGQLAEGHSQVTIEIDERHLQGAESE